MKYLISIYNQYTGQKTIRYIVDASHVRYLADVDAARVRHLTDKVWKEIGQHAFEVVLVEHVM